MYKFIDYSRLFETEMPTDMSQISQPSGVPSNVVLMVQLNDTDIAELNKQVQGNPEKKPFIRPAAFVDRTTMDPNTPIEIAGIGKMTNVVFAIASSNETSDFPQTSDLDQSQHLIFNVHPNQISTGLEQISQAPVELSLVSGNKTYPIILKKSEAGEKQIVTADMVTPEQPVDPQIQHAVETGELLGSNPNARIKSFDAFVSESKKQWIKDIPMKKGALRKEMGKKKGEEITAKEIAKSEAKLKKKDKDKKKPGLQLNPKDAKTHKRNVLAKNLMKASGAIQESRQEKLKGAKDALVKLHEVIEKMIEQTSRKNKGI